MALEKKDWKQQLKEISDPKVTELRNEKEITRAVRFVEEELAAYLDPSTSDAASSPSKSLIIQGLVRVVKNIGLGQTKEELAHVVDELLENVEELDRAARDLIAGAEAQAIELIAELEKVQTRSDDLLPVVSLSEIASELKRRQEMRDRVLQIQEEFENERDGINERIRILKELIVHEVSQNVREDKLEKQKLEYKLDALDKTISAVVEAVAQNDREVELLVAYQNAIKLTRQGLPSDLFGKKMEFRNK